MFRNIAQRFGIYWLGVLMVIIGFCGSSPTSVLAGESNVAISPNFSTLGIGADLAVRVTPMLTFRVGGNTFPFSTTGTEGDIEYDIDVTLLSGKFLIDVHPFSGFFHISAGALVNGNKADLTALSASTYTIGDVSFPASLVGNLTGTVDFNGFAPYVGFGWGNPFASSGNWSFRFEGGVVFQGSPNVALAADGPISSNPLFLNELEKERQKVEDDIDEYQYYPVLSLSVCYRF